MKRKIYVASSWRNGYYPDVVAKLREAGHDVYDFRNPPSGDPGFKWSSVSEDYMEWSPERCDNSTMTSRLWRLAIRVCWFCPAGEAPIRKRAGLQAEAARRLPTSLNGRSRN